MNTQSKCPICNAPLTSTREGDSVVVRCERCHWSAAATAVEPWMISDVEYDLYATPSELPGSGILVALAQMSGQNALQVRRALLKGRFLVATGYFDEIEPFRVELEKLGIAFEVERANDG